jgi:GNAT superfamily N-acetyltransferase
MPPIGTFIAEAAGEPVGIVAFHGGFSSRRGASGLQVDDLYVVESWRRCGVGAQLLAAVGYEARQRGGDWVAWMVRPDNPLAFAFYRGIGGTLNADFTMYLRGSRLDRLVTRAPRADPSPRCCP